MGLIVLAFISVVITACNGNISGEGSSSIDLVQESNGADASLAQNKRIYLKNASESDFIPYTVEYEGVDKLVICHVPPGNPLNFKTKMIGAASLAAHLNHGSEVFQKNNHVNNGEKTKNEDHRGEQREEIEGDKKASEIYRGEDYLGTCGVPELLEGIIMLDDPVFDIDGIICQDLQGKEFYECLADHDQEIIIEL